MGGLKDTSLFLYMYSLRWRCLSPLFLWVLSVFVSLWMLSSALPAHPTITHPYPRSPFVSPSFFPCPTVLFLATVFTLWNWKQTLRPGCSPGESSASLLMTVCFWFVCCRLRTETGNSKRSWSWLSRSCSRSFARQRLCLRWKLS